MIDQTRLPNELTYIETDQAEEIYDAIKRLVVRGAPAIGCAAALGLGAVLQNSKASNRKDFVAELKRTSDYFSSSRPTAVNLFWALNRCVSKILESSEENIKRLKLILVNEGISILEEDIQMCRSIGEHGLSLIKDGFGILTHCNAGALATGDFGTALSPIYLAHEKGLKVKVYSDETRPLLQGSRLTAWELHRAGIDVTTICDNMAAQVMKEKKINLVITGADRIAANGDSANKIGTYGVAILAKYHDIPFYIAAPSSTIDMKTKEGSAIPIEQRNGDEIRKINNKYSAPEKVNVYNPAFDVVPNDLISGIITEKGILRKPFLTSIENSLNNS
ncbi:MAG: S-methyl-5-thioribose-1-phosphate isomerase [Lentisphaerae bacterium GWF2_38_69]|nr:MAG: S-methyl-5-thioribose-1-phosphate isomerase [Lentisphaerae bacterium GWF2_38_69]